LAFELFFAPIVKVKSSRNKKPHLVVKDRVSIFNSFPLYEGINRGESFFYGVDYFFLIYIVRLKYAKSM
jgi:hypothetical protein